MNNLKTLIDKAEKVCGSADALAARMGVKANVISMLKHGRTITPETAAELADIAGEDAREAAIFAMLERAKGTRREGVLREVLGKAQAAGVAAVLVFSYNGDSNSATAMTRKPTESVKTVNSLYIVEDGAMTWPSQAKRFMAIKIIAAYRATVRIFHQAFKPEYCRLNSGI